MKIYRVRHTIFDKIEGSEVMARQTVKEIFFAKKEHAEMSVGKYLEKAKSGGREFTDKEVEKHGVSGYYFPETEAMVSLDELEVFTGK